MIENSKNQATTLNNKGRKVLGRGLSALLGDESIESNVDKSNIFYCDINLLVANQNQPRKHFDEESLDELAESIKEHGILQPLLVRKKTNGYYEIVAGERRYRAAKLAGLQKIPVIVKELSNKQTLQIALIENVQRKDLSPIEEALAYKILIEEYALTQEEVAKQIGKKRSTITNYLRLLKLPDYIKEALDAGKITMGHARTLLSFIDEPQKLKELYERIINENLSVRDVEKESQNYKISKTGTKQNTIYQASSIKSSNSYSYQNTSTFTTIENELTKNLKTRVKIKGNEKKGKIIIEFFSKSDFDRLVEILLEKQI